MDVTTEEIARRIEEPGLTVLDVRSEAEYTGRAGAPCDPRQGHIPGAVNVDVSRLMSLEPEGVRDLLGLPAGAEIVTYCHSGSRSALAAAVLSAAGYEARNYVGSWHEWSRDPALPVVAAG
jgi:thiosulfate/3-mercaptopyruvate sulfurtransferase